MNDHVIFSIREPLDISTSADLTKTKYIEDLVKDAKVALGLSI